ncbi:putative DNA processing protein [Klebsiella pneumoniae]|uniref:Putative DNA processing protein n=1 Tax=Klebsiella pneumoniae TaxID=573 RepID=A0A377XIF1_KLEPN|nr:putative DNA processing protein [Klebsiella pneumoniae]
MILIDPPYEIKTDYQAVVTGINEGYKRFATGTYALWYPVVLRAQIKTHDQRVRSHRHPQNPAD